MSDPSTAPAVMAAATVTPSKAVESTEGEAVLQVEDEWGNKIEQPRHGEC